MGIAFIYAGTKIAPLHKIIAGYILAGLSFVLAGFFLAFAFLASDYWAMWGVFSFITGIGATTYSLSTGEIKL